MTPQEFERLPGLMLEHQVMGATGWAKQTLQKYVEAGVLRRVQPAGAGHGRYQKRQVARLCGLEGQAEGDWERLPLLLGEKTVRRLTGYSPQMLRQIGRARGCTVVRVPGAPARYRKVEVGEWLGAK